MPGFVYFLNLFCTHENIVPRWRKCYREQQHAHTSPSAVLSSYLIQALRFNPFPTGLREGAPAGVAGGNPLPSLPPAGTQTLPTHATLMQEKHTDTLKADNTRCGLTCA